MPLALDADLTARYRLVRSSDAPEAWAAFAAACRRAGRLPRDLEAGTFFPRLRTALAASPAASEAATLIEFFLPIRVLPQTDCDPVVGLPVSVLLRETGARLVLTDDRKGWAAPRPLRPEELAAGLGREVTTGRLDGSNRARAWFDAAEFAQTLCDRARLDGSLAVRWEIRLGRSSKRRHLVPDSARSLVLAPNRKRPSAPEIRIDRIYAGDGSGGFRRFLRFFKDGRVHFASSPSRTGPLARRRQEDLWGGDPGGRGRYRREGRRIEFSIRIREGVIDYDGFVDDDGYLCLRSHSQISQSRDASRFGAKKPPST